MQELFSLGKLFVSDFLKPGEEPRHPPVDLSLVIGDYGIVHLKETAPANSMWGERYWYRSSINSTMRGQLKNVVDSILSVFDVPEGSLWIDVASNDGHLLSCVPENVTRVGIDPANDSFRLECERHADLVIQDYFTAKTFKESKYGTKKARVITTISMFYDISRPVEFIKDILEILEDDGLWVVQMSYTPLMLKQMAWDNIVHEHWAYYSLFNLKALFKDNGIKILDCELNNTNAGSFRVYCMKDGADYTKFGSPTHRDVCNIRISSLLSLEKGLNLYSSRIWIDFFDKIETLKIQVTKFLQEEVDKGKKIMGYGASTKGATITQYMELQPFLYAIADRSPYKHGLKTVDGIPIISEDAMRAFSPDYLIIFPFHFLQEFMEREKKYLEEGGKMIILSPEFRIVTKDDLK